MNPASGEDDIMLSQNKGARTVHVTVDWPSDAGAISGLNTISEHLIAKPIVFSDTLSEALSPWGRQHRLALFLRVAPTTVKKWVDGVCVPRSKETYENIAAFFRKEGLAETTPIYCSAAFWILQANPMVVEALKNDPYAWAWLHELEYPRDEDVTETDETDLFNEATMAQAKASDPEVHAMLMRLRTVNDEVQQTATDLDKSIEDAKLEQLRKAASA